jgi:hypothetical protein
MTRKNKTLLFALLVAVMLILTACAGEAGPQGEAGPAGPQGEAGPAGADAVFSASDLGCVDCHNDTTLIAGKQVQYEDSMHANGEAFGRGTSASCVACHSGGGFSMAVAAGLNPGEMEEGDPNPTRQDCRTCHEVHTSYTGDDWALETTAPVEFYAFEGVTYDGGEGNLCANCHQPRRGFEGYVSEDGTTVTGISSHWGPHHGGQGSMVLGIAGAGVEGKPGPHYKVENTCVTCHMGEGANHTWEPQESACAECHDEDFDFEEAQAEVQAKLDELGEKLVTLGLLSENGPDGHPAVASDDLVPVDQATALWNWIYIAHEDGSLGVHNMGYTMDLIDASLALLP